jgi:hypothetical protein
MAIPGRRKVAGCFALKTRAEGESPATPPHPTLSLRERAGGDAPNALSDAKPSFKSPAGP